MRQQRQYLVSSLEGYASDLPATLDILRDLLGDTPFIRRNENGDPLPGSPYRHPCR